MIYFWISLSSRQTHINDATLKQDEKDNAVLIGTVFFAPPIRMLLHEFFLQLFLTVMRMASWIGPVKLKCTVFNFLQEQSW
jgi:hypothetical protein